MLGRWHSHTMQALARRGEPAPAANEVWYWADSQVTLNNQTNVVEHTFAGGRGVITYRADLATMPVTLLGTPVVRVQLPPNITSFAVSAFNGCTSLVDIIMPGVTAIANYAFNGCSALALTSLSDGVTSINGSAFYGCSSLALTSLPTALASLGNNAFWSCAGLAITEIPATVATIGNGVFRNCTGLTSLTFLGTPTSIGTNVFNGCTNLATIRVPWSQGAVAGAPWGAPNTATIIYNYTP